LPPQIRKKINPFGMFKNVRYLRVILEVAQFWREPTKMGGKGSF